MDFNVPSPTAWGWNFHKIELKFEHFKTILEKKKKNQGDLFYCFFFTIKKNNMNFTAWMCLTRK